MLEAKSTGLSIFDSVMVAYLFSVYSCVQSKRLEILCSHSTEGNIEKVSRNDKKKVDAKKGKDLVFFQVKKSIGRGN